MAKAPTGVVGKAGLDQPITGHVYQNPGLGGQVVVESAKDAAKRQQARAAGAGRRAPSTAPTPKVKGALIDGNKWADSGAWVKVKSTNVAGIKYDLMQKHLFVEFNNRSVYLYSGVPTATAKDMFHTGSMGKFVHRRLKNKFPYARIK